MVQRRMLALTAALGAAAILLGGCAKAPEPSKIRWVELESLSIVGLDGTQSIYLQGSRLNIEGGSLVDYRYAERTDEGALREDLVSSALNRLTEDRTKAPYGSPYVVDIYDDAAKDDARLVVLECQQPKVSNGWEDEPADEDASSWDLLGLSYYPCVTSDGREADYRVELHVPAGTVSQEFGEAPAPAMTPAADEPVPSQ